MSEYKYSIILIDADDTLFDFKKAEREALAKTAHSFGISISEKDYEEYSKINAHVWKLLESGILDRAAMRVHRFDLWQDYMNLTFDSEEFNRRYIIKLSKCGHLFDGVEEFLENLSKICKVYIVTNGNTDTQIGRLKISGIEKYLSGVFISEQVGYTKPAKEFFDYCFDKIGEQDKSKYLIVGDSLTSDMQGGCNAGIKTCRYIHNGTDCENPLCDYVVTDYDSIFEVLKN